MLSKQVSGRSPVLALPSVEADSGPYLPHKKELVPPPLYVEQGPFLCPGEGCGRRFAKKCHVMAHLRVHRRKKAVKQVWVCPYEGCGKRGISANNRKPHLRTHTGEKPFACPLESCGKLHACANNLKRHLRVHTGAQPFVCPREDCARRFAQSGNLAVHLRGHTAPPALAYSCEVCGMRAAYRNAIRVHAWRHTGNKPCVCPHEDCRQRFTQTGSLTRHLRRHTGDKPFVCTVEGCGQRFVVVYGLKKHLGFHAREKRFSCPHEDCGRGFAHKRMLCAHLAMHRRDNPFDGSQPGAGTRLVRRQPVRTPVRNSTGPCPGAAQQQRSDSRVGRHGHQGPRWKEERGCPPAGSRSQAVPCGQEDLSPARVLVPRRPGAPVPEADPGGIRSAVAARSDDSSRLVTPPDAPESLASRVCTRRPGGGLPVLSLSGQELRRLAQHGGAAVPVPHRPLRFDAAPLALLLRPWRGTAASAEDLVVPWPAAARGSGQQPRTGAGLYGWHCQ
ncbi:MAG: C2H2-type zinc finger protein [Kistimonas sp.]|nr:C2H2-type zinc finger protein [Kistimonas sp.]